MIHEQEVSKEITVTSIFGNINPPTSNLDLEVSYLVSSNTPLVYMQGDMIYAILYLQGNGTVNGLRVNTQGFSATFLTPELPLRVDNYSAPQIMVVGITIQQCCYQGNISITLNRSN